MDEGTRGEGAAAANQDRPIGDLAKQLSERVSRLVREELRLAGGWSRLACSPVRGELRPLQQDYGSIAVVIIFLVWLWITNLVILIGAEFNAQCSVGHRDPETSAALWKTSSARLRRTGRMTD